MKSTYPKTKPKAPETKPFDRMKAIQICFGIVAIALLARLSFLQFFNKDFLRAQGNARTVRTITIPSYRGLITDRRGSPMAVSTPVDSVWVNPKFFQANEKQLLKLSQILDLPANEIATKIKQQSRKGFVYLKRAITPDRAKAIHDLHIPGVQTQREFRRYYPAGPVTSQLLGFTNIDDRGQAGIELAYDHWLKPTPGKKKVLEDRIGHWVQDLDCEEVPKEGKHLALSIDLRIQTLAYNTLMSTIERLHAKSATLVMLDVKTGEVLAMVSAPSYNPNDYNERQGQSVRNRAVTDQIEPGSTIKPLTMVSLLEHGNLSLDDTIDTNPGFYRLSGHTIRDIHNFGHLSISQILVKSSNIGLSKLVSDRPSEELIDIYKRFGIGSGTNNLFPGEMSGYLPDPPKNAFIKATLSFGYGLTTTPVQLAHAYATLAARGKKIPMSLLKISKNDTPKGEKIISQETADHVVKMLTEVMNMQGTGTRARIKGYQTAGKTGTTRLVGSSGYDANRHNAMFVGFTPVDNPRLATLVLIEEPEENDLHYYGGMSAAPVYAEVVKNALHMLNVPPDSAIG